MAEEETPLTSEDVNAIMLALMRIEASLERVEGMLREEDDGQEEEPDA